MSVSVRNEMIAIRVPLVFRSRLLLVVDAFNLLSAAVICFCTFIHKW